MTGILDFGDALTGPVAMDVGVAACYQLGAAAAARAGRDLLAPALDVVAGYHAVDPLSCADLDLVAEFLVARVAARIILSQAHAARDPANAGYLLRRTPAAIAHFAALRAIGTGRDRPPPGRGLRAGGGSMTEPAPVPVPVMVNGFDGSRPAPGCRPRPGSSSPGGRPPSAAPTGCSTTEPVEFVARRGGVPVRPGRGRVPRRL